MEITSISRINTEIVNSLVSNLKRQLDQNSDVDLFDGLPTKVIMPPSIEFDSSFHCMFFPSNQKQRFHYHPSSRYLLVIGNVDLHVSHSLSDISDNPYDKYETKTVFANSLSAIRFKKEHWHYFSSDVSTNIEDSGVVAFSFHGKDDVDIDLIENNLMEELTFFWEE